MPDPYQHMPLPAEFYAAAGSRARLAILLYLGQHPQGASLAELAQVVEPVLGTVPAEASMQWLIQSMRASGVILRSGWGSAAKWFSPASRQAAAARAAHCSLNELAAIEARRQQAAAQLLGSAAAAVLGPPADAASTQAPTAQATPA